MSNMAEKYLKEDYGFSYAGSLYSMKPILKASEIGRLAAHGGPQGQWLDLCLPGVVGKNKYGLRFE